MGSEMCIRDRVSFFLGPVPYTMQNVGIVLVGLLLPPRNAVYSQLLYMFLIALGLPMASGFRGGLHILLGYTGGYIAGFPIASFLMSVFTRFYLRRKSIKLYSIGLRDFASLLCFSAIAVLPVYLLGFLVFTYYALLDSKLFLWASNIANIVGGSGNKILTLFIATVAVFAPQDLLMDHVVAISVAEMVTMYLENRGVVFE